MQVSHFSPTFPPFNTLVWECWQPHDLHDPTQENSAESALSAFCTKNKNILHLERTAEFYICI